MMAIKVLKLLKKDFPMVKLCMVGPDKDGELERCRKAAKDEGILNSITFTGKLDKEEWIQISSSYDIFINTTNVDNMPVSIIEAMALGFPIVSTNAGGLPYLISDNINGLLVDKDSPDQMSKLIASIISDSSLSSIISSNARKKSMTFNKNNIVSKWHQLIDEALELKL